MLKIREENGMWDYIGQRKHVSQMTDSEINSLFRRLKGVEARGLKWRMNGHAFDRIHEKGIEATYEDVISSIHDCKIIEYKIDHNTYRNIPEERVVIRANSVVNRNYNLNVVFSLTNKRVVTVWINHIKDLHSTLDWSIYNADMKVFGVIR